MIVCLYPPSVFRTDIELNTLYAIKDTQNVYHRVKVVDLSAPGSRGVSDVATVLYVDVGREAVVETDSLLELPQPWFHTVPYQAVELYACRVKPRDNDLEWIARSEAYMSERLYNKELYGHVVLSLGACVRRLRLD